MTQDPIIVEVEGVGELEFPGGTDPAVIQAAVRRVTGGGEATPTGSKLAPGPDESRDAFIERSLRMWGEPILPGVRSVASAAGPVRSFLSTLAPGVMRKALGAQQALRGRFPNVDLEAVALREGAVPGQARSAEAVAGKARAAGRAVKDAARQATGTISARQVVRGQPGQVSLRSIYDDAKTAQRPDVQQAVLDRVRQIRAEYGPGLSFEGGQARKQFLQQEAKSALRAPAGPRDAGMTSQLANAERAGIVRQLRTNPDVAGALDRSQELLMLNRAMDAAGRRTSVLRDALAGAAGTAAGLATGNPASAMLMGGLTAGVNHAINSPVTHGRVANLLSRTGQAPASGEMQAALAQLLAVLNGQE